MFTSPEVVKEHYKSDWHIFNSKRRANNLAPLSLSDFRKVSPSIKLRSAAPNPRPQASASEVKAGATSEVDLRVRKARSTQSVEETSSEFKELAEKLGVHPARVDNVVQLALESRVEEKSESDDDDSVEDTSAESAEESEGAEEAENPPVITPLMSIFDEKIFDTTEECLQYMELTYGFFVPDREYLVDLDGLLTYLGEKVRIGGLCIYCQKQLRPGRPCQNHMISKSHCKIAYEEEIDLDEFEDFYDFSSSYGDEEVGEDGELVQRTLEISHLGELILLDGRTVGTRHLRHYYKQKYRPIDDRPCILAQKREQLLRLELQFGAVRMDPASIERLSDVQVVAMLKREQKEARKALVLSQRAQRRQEFKNQRRAYTSNVNALRSSEITTAKIRDYHSRLV
jgi:pre-60S factor REI1